MAETVASRPANGVYAPLGMAKRQERTRFMPYGVLPADADFRAVNSNLSTGQGASASDVIVPRATSRRKRHGRPLAQGAHGNVLVLDGSDDEDLDAKAGAEGEGDDGSHSDDDELLAAATGGIQQAYAAPLLSSSRTSRGTAANAASKSRLSHSMLTKRYIEARRAKSGKHAAAIILGEPGPDALAPCCCGRLSYLSCGMALLASIVVLLGTAYPLLRFVAGPALASHTSSQVLHAASATALRLGTGMTSDGTHKLGDEASPDLQLDVFVAPWHEWYADPRPVVDFGAGAQAFLLDDAASCTSPPPASPSSPQLALGAVQLPQLAMPDPSARGVTMTVHRMATPGADAPPSPVVGANVNATSLLAAAALSRRSVCVVVSAPAAQVTVSSLPGVLGFLRHTYPSPVLVAWELDTGADAAFAAAPATTRPAPAAAAVPPPSGVQVDSFVVQAPPQEHASTLPDAAAWLGLRVTLTSAKRVTIADLGALRLAVVVNRTLDSAWLMPAAAATAGPPPNATEGPLAAAPAPPLLPFPGFSRPVQWVLEGPLYQKDAAAASALLDELSDDGEPVAFTVVGQAAAPAAALPGPSASSLVGGGVYGRALGAAPAALVIPSRVPPIVEGLRLHSLDIAPQEAPPLAAGAVAGAAVTGAVVNVTMAFTVRNPVAAFVAVSVARVSLDVDLSTGTGASLGRLLMQSATASPLAPLPAIPANSSAAASALPCQLANGTWSSDSAAAALAADKYACIEFAVSALASVDVSADGGLAWGDYVRDLMLATDPVPLQLKSRSDEPGHGGIGHGGIVIVTESALGEDEVEAPVASVAANSTPAAGFAVAPLTPTLFTVSSDSTLHAALSLAVTNPSTVSFDLGPDFVATLTGQAAPAAVLANITAPAGTSFRLVRGTSTVAAAAPLPRQPAAAPLASLSALLSDFAFGRPHPVRVQGVADAAPSGGANGSHTPASSPSQWLSVEAAAVSLLTAVQPAQSPTAVSAAALTAAQLDLTAADSAVSLGAAVALSPVRIPLPLADLSIPQVRDTSVRLSSDGSVCLSAATLPASFARSDPLAAADAQPGVDGSLHLAVPAGTSITDCGAASMPQSPAATALQQLVDGVLRGTASGGGTVSLPFDGSLSLQADTALVAGLQLTGMPLKGVAGSLCSVQVGDATAAGVASFAMTPGTEAGSVAVTAQVTLTPAAASCDTTVLMPSMQMDVLVATASPGSDAAAQAAVTLTVPPFQLHGGKAGPPTQLTATGTITPQSASANAALRAIVSAALSGQTVAASLQPHAAPFPPLAAALAAIQYSVDLPTPGGVPGTGQLLRAASIAVDQFVTGSAATASAGTVTLFNPLGVGICVSHGSLTAAMPSAPGSSDSVALFSAALDTTFVPARGSAVAAATVAPAAVGSVVDPLAAALMQAAFFGGARDAADPTRTLPSALIDTPSATGTATITLAAAGDECVQGVSVPASLSSPALSLTLNAPATGSDAASPLVPEGTAADAFLDLTDSPASTGSVAAAPVPAPALGATLGFTSAWQRPVSGSTVAVTSAAVSFVLDAPPAAAEAAGPMATWTVAASPSGHSLSGSTLTLALPTTTLGLPSGGGGGRQALTPLAEAVLGPGPTAGAASLAGYANITVAITVGSSGTPVSVAIPFIPVAGALTLPAIGLSVAPGSVAPASTLGGSAPAALSWAVHSLQLGDLSSDASKLAASGSIVVSNSAPISVVLPSSLTFGLSIQSVPSSAVSGAAATPIPAGTLELTGSPARAGGQSVIALLSGASEPLSFAASLDTSTPALGTLLANRLSSGAGEALLMALQGTSSTSSDPVIAAAAALMAADVTVPPSNSSAPPGSPASGVAPLVRNMSIDCDGFLTASGQASLTAGLFSFLDASSAGTKAELVAVNTTLALCPDACGAAASVECCLGNKASSAREARALVAALSAARAEGTTRGLRAGAEYFATWEATLDAPLLPPSQQGTVTPAQTVAVPKAITVAADIMASVTAGEGGVGRALVAGSVTLRLTPPAAADGSAASPVTLTIDVLASAVALVATGFPHGAGGGGSGGTPPPTDPAKVQKYVTAFAAQGRSEYKSAQFHGYYDGDLGLGWDIVSGGLPGQSEGMGALPALFFMHSDPSRTMSGQLLPDDVAFTQLPPSGAKTVPAADAVASATVWEGITTFAADVSSAAAGQLATSPGARPGVLTEASMASAKSSYFDGATTLGQAVVELHAYELDARANVLAGKIQAHPMWLASLTALPTTYSSTGDKQSWAEFLSQWGSHITVTTTTGGLIHCYAQFDYGLLQTNPWGATFTAATATSAVQDFCARSTGISTTGQWAGIPAPSAAQKVFEAHISGQGSSSLGGNPTDWHPGQQGPITSWLESVMTAPGIVRASVIGADELAKVWAPSKAAALSAAIAATVAAGEADWAPGKVATCPSACTNGACSGSADSCSCTNSHQFGRLCQACETGWITASCASPDCRSEGNCNEPNGHCASPGTCSCASCWDGPECMTYTCGCFGVNTTVEVQGKGATTAGSLQVGDAVRSVDDSGRLVWSPVYHVQRPGPEAEINASLVDVRVAPAGTGALTLRVTAEHLVFVVKPAALSSLLSPVSLDELRRGSGMLDCTGRSACPTIANAAQVPASLLRAGDVVLAAASGGVEGATGLRRVLGVEAASGDGVVTVHTLAGPVVASGIVASSFECDAEHGYWDTVDLRAAYQMAPWLAKAGWFRDAVSWADRVIYDGSPSLARAFGAVVPQPQRSLEAELFPQLPEAGSVASEQRHNDGPAPATLPAPYCPDGSRGRAVLDE